MKQRNDDIDILSNLGNTFVKLKDYPNAWLAFEEAIKLHPTNKKIFENYLLIICESQDMRLFDDVLDKAKFLSPEETERLYSIGNEFKNAIGYSKDKQNIKKMGSIKRSKAGKEFMRTLAANSAVLSGLNTGRLEVVEEEKDK